MSLCHCHSPDFRSVRWYGADYVFTPAQAAVVAVLWPAWESGTPDVGVKTIRKEAGLRGGRMAEVFRRGRKHHLAWKTMIVPGRTNGTYRLQEPSPD
jgi:hypothetical protein